MIWSVIGTDSEANHRTHGSAWCMNDAFMSSNRMKWRGAITKVGAGHTEPAPIDR
jgi:hypothetical protein